MVFVDFLLSLTFLWRCKGSPPRAVAYSCGAPFVFSRIICKFTFPITCQSNGTIPRHRATAPPRAASRQPRAASGEPRAASREPRAASSEPRAASRAAISMVLIDFLLSLACFRRCKRSPPRGCLFLRRPVCVFNNYMQIYVYSRARSAGDT